MNSASFFDNLYSLPVEDLIRELNALGVACCPPSAIKTHLIRPHIGLLTGAPSASRPQVPMTSSRDAPLSRRVQSITNTLVLIMLDADTGRKIDRLSKLSKSIQSIYKEAETLPPSESLPLRLSLSSFIEVTNSVAACITKKGKVSPRS